MSSTRVHCVMDKAVQGNMTVEISNNGQDFSADGVEYMATLSLPEQAPLHESDGRGVEEPVVVTGIVPSAGAVEGSTLVQVLGSGFRAGSGLGCMFALAAGDGGGSTEMMTVEGRWETSSMMACVSPRAGVEQTVSVEVSNNGADVTSSGVQFVYERAPTVSGVELSNGGDGRVLRVTGKHFVPSQALQCSTGTQARYVSSSEVHCRVADMGPIGNVTVEVSNNGQDFSTNGIRYVGS